MFLYVRVTTYNSNDQAMEELELTLSYSNHKAVVRIGQIHEENLWNKVTNRCQCYSLPEDTIVVIFVNRIEWLIGH